MKKKILSFVLLIAMLASLVVVPAYAAPADGYKMNIELTKQEIVDGTQGYRLTWQFQGTGMKNTYGTMFTIDSSKFDFINTNSDASPDYDLTLTKNGMSKKASWPMDETAATLFKQNGKMGETFRNVNPELYLLDLGGNKTLVRFELSNSNTRNCDVLKDVGYIDLKLKDGVAIDEIDSTWISYVKPDVVQTYNQVGVAWVQTTTGTLIYGYPDGSEDTFAAPSTTVNGAPIKAAAVALTGLTVSLGNTSLAVPTAAQKTATTTATAAAVPSDATLPADVAYSIDPAYPGVSVNASGVVTVTPSAAAGNVTVKATSASKSVSGTATLKLTKATPAAADFTVAPTSVSLKPGKTQQLTVSNVKDQFGAAFTATPSYAMKAGSNANITVSSSGLITVNSAATAGQTGTVEVTVGAVKKEVTVTVASKSANTITGIKITPAALTYGAEFTVGVAGTDNNKSAITYTAGTNCQLVSGNQFKVTGVGKVTVTATQADSADVLGGTWTAEATADKATVNVTGVTADNKVYDGNTTATVKGGSTGVTGLNVTVTGAFADKNAGNGKTVNVTATLSDTTNYKLGTVNKVTANITKKPITATVADATRVFGAADPKFSATADGLVTGDGQDAVKYTFSTDATTTSDVGEYVVNATATAANYNVTVTPGKLTITKADMTLAAKTGEVTLTENEDGELVWKLSDVVNANIAIPFDVEKTADPAVFENKEMGVTVTFYEGDEKATEIVTGTEYKVKIEVADNVDAGKNYTLKKTETPVESTITFVVAKQGYDKPYVNGIKIEDEILFQPNEKITRGMVATMIARLSKDFDAEKTYECALPDYNGDGWSGNYVAFCASKGIVGGVMMDDTLMFLPKNNITRAEFAKMVAIAAGLDIDLKDTEYAFDDDDQIDGSTSWAVPYINALKKAGIVDGYYNEDGNKKTTFKPKNEITRAETVKMLNKAFGLDDAEDGEKFETNFPDVKAGDWFWKYVMPAANVPVCDFIK